MGCLLRSLGCGRIALHHSEDVAFGILAVREPAYSGNGHLWDGDQSTASQNSFDRLINIRDADGVDTRLIRITTTHQAAVYPRLWRLPGGNRPVLHGAGPFGDLPAEDGVVKSDSSLWILCGNFKMNWSWHKSSFLAEYEHYKHRGIFFYLC
jgi:hypothetical protein